MARIQRIVKEEASRVRLKHGFGSNASRQEIVKEANDSDMQRIIDDLINKFYDVAFDYEQYQPIQYRNLTPDERDVINTFDPPEFADQSMISDPANTGRELHLSSQEQARLDIWLEEKLEQEEY